MNLVIVESPAKAKTIEGFLGKDFTVKSSYGHVRDLAKKELSIDVSNHFIPKYEILPDKKDVIKELKKLADKAEIIWLATDEDREGEAISWHLFEALKLKNDNTKRIVFNEITKKAILNAIDNPRSIDKNLVDAQQARRVLDRLVGFELSPVLWKKVKPSLSAGRVQSVAVRLIVEREKEIELFKSESFFKTTGIFKNSTHHKFSAELTKKISDQKEVQNLLSDLKEAVFNVKSIETKPSKRTPSAPFTTSTLQQEASRKLGFSVSKTMMVAQRLYESGKITYMRTDSVNLSDTAINAAQEEVIKSFGQKYSNPKKYVTKSKSAQEAHEAIRPTYFNLHSIDSEYDEQRLYELIWKRTIASQMMEAQIDKTTVQLINNKNNEIFQAIGEVIVFDGFMKVYMESSDIEEPSEDSPNSLPLLKVGETILSEQITSTQRFTHHPPRYTEASLVKKLEENGIGRPSTYAPTISTIQKREYVVKKSTEGEKREYVQMILQNNEIKKHTKSEITGAEKNKLFPTDTGVVVNEFLVNNFKEILDYSFTAKVEKEFDDIALGEISWGSMIKSFYTPFHHSVENAMKNSEKAKGERLLGIDPKTGKNIYAKIGKYGALIQLGENEDEEKPKFASLLKGMSLSSISLSEALLLLELPKKLGDYKNTPIEVNNGKFGPYVKWNSKFFSIPTTFDLLSVTYEDAIKIIEDKIEKDANKLVKEFAENKEVKILNGRWGPYINIGKNNYKIPKGKEAKDLSLQDCLDIAENSSKEGKVKSKKK